MNLQGCMLLGAWFAFRYLMTVTGRFSIMCGAELSRIILSSLVPEVARRCRSFTLYPISGGAGVGRWQSERESKTGVPIKNSIALSIVLRQNLIRL